ncbi:MAG: aminodeoxychorismate/anthranilate synthase component II [Rhodospirillales bacterium]|nr:aminodeoxychorismate/anthranilate synthase component II [Rhodospirillales bacterium]
MFVLIDNYDSFTYNLLHYIGELGTEVVVHRNDALTADDVMGLGAEGIVLSPGPCDPDRAGICLELVEKAAGRIPLFGVCLGHQCIGQVFGGKVVRSPEPMHGKVSDITHTNTGVFEGLPSPFIGTRYHSLSIDPATVPDCLDVNATSADGVVQGMSHKEFDIHGVQFHPESIETQHGHKLLQNFINIASRRQAA